MGLRQKSLAGRRTIECASLRRHSEGYFQLDLIKDKSTKRSRSRPTHEKHNQAQSIEQLELYIKMALNITISIASSTPDEGVL